jgi:hypothetical protein
MKSKKFLFTCARSLAGCRCLSTISVGIMRARIYFYQISPAGLNTLWMIDPEMKLRLMFLKNIEIQYLELQRWIELSEN